MFNILPADQHFLHYLSPPVALLDSCFLSFSPCLSNHTFSGSCPSSQRWVFFKVLAWTHLSSILILCPLGSSVCFPHYMQDTILVGIPTRASSLACLKCHTHCLVPSTLNSKPASPLDTHASATGTSLLSVLESLNLESLQLLPTLCPQVHLQVLSH